MTKTEYTEKIEEILGEDAYNYGAFQADDNKTRFGYTAEELAKIQKAILSLIPELVRSFLPEKTIDTNLQVDEQQKGFNKCLNQIEDRLKTWESEGK